MELALTAKLHPQITTGMLHTLRDKPKYGRTVAVHVHTTQVECVGRTNQLHKPWQQCTVQTRKVYVLVNYIQLRWAHSPSLILDETDVC